MSFEKFIKHSHKSCFLCCVPRDGAASWVRMCTTESPVWMSPHLWTPSVALDFGHAQFCLGDSVASYQEVNPITMNKLRAPISFALFLGRPSRFQQTLSRRLCSHSRYRASLGYISKLYYNANRKISMVFKGRVLTVSFIYILRYRVSSLQVYFC